MFCFPPHFTYLVLDKSLEVYVAQLQWLMSFVKVARIWPALAEWPWVGSFGACFQNWDFSNCFLVGILLHFEILCINAVELVTPIVILGECRMFCCAFLLQVCKFKWHLKTCKQFLGACFLSLEKTEKNNSKSFWPQKLHFLRMLICAVYASVFYESNPLTAFLMKRHFNFISSGSVYF